LRDLKGKYFIIWTNYNKASYEWREHAVEILKAYVTLIIFGKDAFIETTYALPKLYSALDIQYREHDT
jgi:hypothetical protein